MAAARRVLERDGVTGMTLRAVSAEAGVPLGTLHYAFASKDLMIRAVIEDLTAEIATVLRNADTGSGLEHAIRQGMETYWIKVVEGKPELPLMQHELFIFALRTPGMENLGRWQMENYSRVVAAWCQEAASKAGEICSVPFDALARVIVASNIGIVLQYIADPDPARSRRDLQAVIDLMVHLAGVRRSSANDERA